MNRTAVVAIGGNALLQGGASATIAEQFDAARSLASSLVEMIEAGWRIVVTHGNGPQVGFIKRRSDLVAELAPELPHLDLDMCVADSQGSLGYILASSLGSRLRERGVPDRVAALLTHTVVDAADPAFHQPTKPIGGFYPEDDARRLADVHHWTIAEDSGRGWRRLVPSPRPRRIVEQESIRMLADGGVLVVAAGGGGIPVVETPDGRYRGVEAVIDKDLTSAHLATKLGADLLVITTGVAQVAVNFGRPDQQTLDRLSAAEARRHLADGQFPPGSMGPKIEAALQFLDEGGRRVLITSPDELVNALGGSTGTWLLPSDIEAPALLDSQGA
ncbi:MAG: carbamate kinase [Propionibacteriales bacterium]|nr:carbamate kinase [Propionibacteriales bacterium]